MNKHAAMRKPFRPHPVVAVLLSWLTLGMGHAYAGSFRRALAVASVNLLMPVILALAVVSPFDARLSYLAGVAIIGGFWVLVLIDASRTARKTLQVSHTARRRLAMCLLLYIGTVGLALGEATAMRSYWLQAFRVPTGSMKPGMLIGDYIMVNKWAYRRRDPQVGELMVFQNPRDPKVIYIKRIVGTPGDSLSYLNGALRVSGLSVTSAPVEYPGIGVVRMESLGAASYAVFDDPILPVRDQAPMLVPDGGYYVLGDNRDNSLDSRSFGSVERAAMIGPIMKIYFSRDPETKRIRWERIGRDPGQLVNGRRY